MMIGRSETNERDKSYDWPFLNFSSLLKLRARESHLLCLLKVAWTLRHVFINAVRTTFVLLWFPVCVLYIILRCQSGLAFSLISSININVVAVRIKLQCKFNFARSQKYFYPKEVNNKNKNKHLIQYFLKDKNLFVHFPRWSFFFFFFEMSMTATRWHRLRDDRLFFYLPSCVFF